MKIKKVEIQAFRAYDKVEHGTFDFTSDNGNIANFVTLYAPNGFGKTSFYDAVEWGVTNNISRFLRKKTDNESSAKAEKNKYIWRHNKSNDDTPSFVRISTDDNDKTFYRVLCHKLKSNQRDAKFDDKLTEERNKYFLDVMLSQEQISAFLKEDDASLRYEKFIATFGDKKIDQNYKHITELVNFNKKKIKSLKDRAKELKNLLNEDVDRDILKNINSIINEVNKSGGSLPNITTNYSNKDDAKLKILIIDLLNKYDSDVKLLTENINKIEDFLSDENKNRIAEFDKIYSQIVTINEKISKNKVFLSDINKKNVKERTVNAKKKSFDELKKLRDQFLELDLNIIELERIKNSLSKLRLEVETLNGKRTDAKLELNNISKVIREAKIKSESLEVAKNDLMYRLQNAVLEYKLNDSRLKEIDLLKKEINRKKYEVEEIKLESNHFNSLKKNALKHASDFKVNKFNDKLVEIYPNIKEEFYSTVKSFENLNILKKKLDSLDLEIEQSHALGTDIKDLIKSGTNLVSRNSLTECPLCSKEYANFKDLLGAIESNLLFDDMLKGLISEKNLIELDYLEEKNRFNTSKNSISNYLSEAIVSYEVRIDKNSTLRQELIQDKQNSEAKLKSVQSVVSAFNRATESRKLGDYEDHLNNEIDKIESSIDKFRLVISNNEKLKNVISSKIDIINANSDSILENINSLSNEPLLIHAQELIGSKDMNKISKSYITQLIESSGTELSDKNDEIDNLQNQIRDIELKYSNIEYSEVESEIQKLRNERIEINNHLKVVRYFIEEHLKIEINDTNINDLLNLVLSKKKALQSSLDSKMEAIVNLSSIDQYRERVIPFLKHNQYLEEYNDNASEMEFLVDFLGKKLDKERKSIANFIEKEVQSFFFQDLINKFYKKIDPHPQYKEISFKCDFSSVKPKLHVLVASEERKIVPTLYFSSAQLNALSLSVFLAKAINVKNPESDQGVDSIFIDDPIQAMDSINILSVIDLLRSITVNFKKQIILSTHDDNFFELLKRKVPSTIFDSKFIELESYGKVGKEIDFSNEF
ncbi:AAA family ATPase [Vibrio fortis]|uniref:AAA family ATPase n=1 Tax=Vibrio fortis TaxID=212667 RepID=UPI0038CD5A76